MVSRPLSIADAKITDAFWKREMDLVKDAVIPYQWEALNDRIPDAAPSWWMHNMRAAARAIAARKAGRYAPLQKMGPMVVEPTAGQPPLADAFYGWAFQDSDGYKWLEAVAYQLIRQPDPRLQRQAQEAIDAICAAQEEDGYIDTFYTIIDRGKAFSNLKDHHELYCFGHLTEAAVAWHQATGHEDLLNVARRFARCISGRFGPGKERGCPGHEIAEMALFRLYEETGEREWLELACFFLDVRGTAPSTFALEENRRRSERGEDALPVAADRYAYYQAHLPVRQVSEAVGHAVRQMYLCCGMTDEARLTGDMEMLNACKRLWHSVVQEKMYVTGGVGGTHDGEAFSHPYDLPSDTAYSETCAAIGLMFWARRMLQLQPVSQYADVMELALYNTVLAGMSLDGKRFFYVNPLEVDPEACKTDRRLSHVKPERQKWFGCACCPPNIARLVSSLPAYIVTTTNDTVYFHLYIGSEISVSLNGENIRMRMDADLLQDGRAALTVVEGKAQGRLAFRIPVWTKNATISSVEKLRSEKDGYLILEGVWKKGDAVQLNFPMSIRVLSASPLVRETAGQLCIARGPLVYCAEEADNGKLLHMLRLSPDCAEKATVEILKIGVLPLPVIKVPGKRIKEEPETALYAEWHAPEMEDTDIRCIPYFAWNNRGMGEMRVWLHQL